MGDLRVFVPAIVRKRRQLREYTERGCDLVVHDVDGCLTATPVGDAPSTGGIAPGSAEWSAMLVSDRPVHLDLRGCASLTPTAHAAVCSLVRVARRFDRPVTADGWTDALRESFDSYGTREWIDRVLAAPPVTDADAQPHPSPRTIEMTRQWTQN